MIQFFYFEECPNYSKSLENLLEVISELNIDKNDLEIINIKDLESAKRYNFQGSPSIIVNGIDIYTEKKKTEGVNYTCRLYKFNNVVTGIIPKEFIKEKILKFY